MQLTEGRTGSENSSVEHKAFVLYVNSHVHEYFTYDFCMPIKKHMLKYTLFHDGNQKIIET